MIVNNYTFIEFMNTFVDACHYAWNDGHKDIEFITLPEGLFPCLEECVNPITRSVVKVKRTDLLSLCTFAANPKEEL